MLAIGLEQAPTLLQTQEAKFNFKIKTAQRRLVQMLHQIGGGNKHALKRLHLRQHFVHLRHLPRLAGLASVHQEAVYLIKNQHGIVARGFFKCGRNQLLALTHVFRQQI